MKGDDETYDGDGLVSHGGWLRRRRGDEGKKRGNQRRRRSSECMFFSVDGPRMDTIGRIAGFRLRESVFAAAALGSTQSAVSADPGAYLRANNEVVA